MGAKSINFNQEPIVLVCAADENYAMPLAVTVYSASLNLKSQQRIELFVIDGGIKESTKSRIKKSLASESITISWVQPTETLFNNLPLTDTLTTATYYRLLIAQLIPTHFHKAIYLDTDVVVKGDLSQLWNIDIGDNYVLAVQDISQRSFKYFNSGVLVINLEKWRTDNTGSKVIEYIEQNRDSIRWLDQDGLNGVLAEKWGELDPRWNQMHAIHEYSSWRESPYAEDVYNDVLHNPYIVHFTTPPKPWQKGCKHPGKDLFFQYLDMTDWSGWRNTIWRRMWRRVRKEAKRLWGFTKNAYKTRETLLTTQASVPKL
jgi:lipopolysaccharide biosynthesis glycosyltransferase